jgi:uncharacterized repeat protein (TIGR01451 family)
VCAATALLLGLLLAMGSPVDAGPSAHRDSTDAVPRRSAEMALELVSRTFDASANNWTVVVDATLDSNYLCFPVVYDCIVGELADPANAALTDLQCLSPAWSHVVVFRNHCLRQLGRAGQDAQFRFTYVTDPGVTTGQVSLSVEFGRGVLPLTFSQLASASLVVDLDTALDLSTSCPDSVDAGAAVECTATVSYPFSSGPAIPATIVDEPDGTLITGGTLTQTGGTPSWTCASLTCSATVNAGESATFAYTGTAAASASGGNGSNRVRFTLGGTADLVDEITVVGSGDAILNLAKTASGSTATPGSTLTWTITVQNTGGSGGSDVAASTVQLVDSAPAQLANASVRATGGVGEWSCSGLTCTCASMPVGSATFSVTGTLSNDVAAGTVVLNEADLTWSNDVFGPDYAEVAGAGITVATTTTTTTPATTTTYDVYDTEAPINFAG